MSIKETKIEQGSGNVFKDLGHPDADAHLLKAALVTRIDEIIRQRDLKQVETASLLCGLASISFRTFVSGDLTT